MRFLCILSFQLCFLVSSAQYTLTLQDSSAYPGTFGSDVWGYVDELGNEYAIAADHSSGGSISIFDATDPRDLKLLSTVTDVPGFDVKVYKHYAYTVNGGGSGQGGIVDISDPINPEKVAEFPSSHNIFIAENGYMYAECGGLKIYDLNEDPTAPKLIFYDSTFQCHDATVVGDRLFDFHGTDGTFIYDVSDPSSPVILGHIEDPNIGYHHSGWPSKEGDYLFICDEFSKHPNADVTVWDIKDPSSPERVGEIFDSTAIVHNLFVIGDFAYMSYYTAGIKVYDISDPTHPVLADQFDTEPEESGEKFDGCFGIYPFSPSGTIYATDWHNGLFAFRFSHLEGDLPDQQNFFAVSPNPSGGLLNISYDLPSFTEFSIDIYDSVGRLVQTLQYTEARRGRFSDALDLSAFANGVYFAAMKSENFMQTQKIVISK